MHRFLAKTLRVQEIIDKFQREYEELKKIIERLQEINDKLLEEKRRLRELIERYLAHLREKNIEVKGIATCLISQLRVGDLKDILRDHGIRDGKTRSELIHAVLTNFSFEPYVDAIERYCNVCKVKTPQEIHLNSQWKADYFRCMVCNETLKVNRASGNDSVLSYSRAKVSDVNHNEPLKISSIDKAFPVKSPTVENNRTLLHYDSDFVKFTKKYYWEIIALFITILIGISIRFGVFWGVAVSVSVTFIISVIHFELISRQVKLGTKQI